MDWISDSGEIYKNCAVFFRVKEEFGELSNMASGFPLFVNGNKVYSSEALYQACRFPHEPLWQEEIIAQKNPMAAKMISKKDGRRSNYSRPDWNEICIEIMDWVLRVKLAQNFERFSKVLKSTGERNIVEKSRRDSFWGAVENENCVLTGRNVLGNLLTDLRELVKIMAKEDLLKVVPLNIENFTLLGESIKMVTDSKQ